jgi:Zn-dependent peptidase ImmA (M78 family)/transcriptional regulator with XRE-family HTH domain
MTITQQELGKRLKQARDTCGFSQQDVATYTELPRTAIAQIEGGNRAVSSIELDKLSRLYKRLMSDFFADTFEEDPTHVLLRALDDGDFGEGGVDRQFLLQCAKLCREITILEKLLDLPVSPIVPVSYSLEPPSNRWDAVQQGIYAADQERKRLGLGANAIADLADLIRRQGVRVAEHHLPPNFSGVFFHGKEIGFVMIVNSDHVISRRSFTYAHEYCHVLTDRSRSSLISHSSNRDELIEVRANAFAPHFLMPEGGVREFLHNLGKAEQLRQVFEVFDGQQQVAAQRRTPSKIQSIDVHHAVLLAYNFGLSYEATLYQLLNLKLITKDRLEELRSQSHRVPHIEHIFNLQCLRRRTGTGMLTDQLMELAFEAYERDVISKRKLFELARDAAIPQDDLERALGSDEPEAVGAILPV